MFYFLTHGLEHILILVSEHKPTAKKIFCLSFKHNSISKVQELISLVSPQIILLCCFLSFDYFSFNFSTGFRGSRESLHSGMTYSARRGSNASIYGAEGEFKYFLHILTFFVNFHNCNYCYLSLFPFLAFSLFCEFFVNSDDYYYGGSMRDLSSRHGNRRKSSSASHIGKRKMGTLIIWYWYN